MGVIITSQSLERRGTTGLLKPIIYCNPSEQIIEQAVSVNVLLSKYLSYVKPARRSMRLESCFNPVIDALPEDSIIKEFDVLFHPDYQVDILRMMVNACKRKPFRIIWPGRYSEGKLLYAEYGYRDYKEYIIQDYDITCII